MFIMTLNTQVQFGVREGTDTRSPNDTISFGYTRGLLGVQGKKKGRKAGKEMYLKLKLANMPSKWYFSGSSSHCYHHSHSDAYAIR